MSDSFWEAFCSALPEFAIQGLFFCWFHLSEIHLNWFAWRWQWFLVNAGPPHHTLAMNSRVSQLLTPARSWHIVKTALQQKPLIFLAAPMRCCKSNFIQIFIWVKLDIHGQNEALKQPYFSCIKDNDDSTWACGHFFACGTSVYWMQNVASELTLHIEHLPSAITWPRCLHWLLAVYAPWSFCVWVGQYQ